MTTYTKTILIIAGLFLIPAILISQNYTSADNTELSAGTVSTPTIQPSTSDIIIDTPTTDPDPTAPDVIVPNTFLFFDINTFFGIDSWSEIIPDINIPNDTTTPNNTTPSVTVASLLETWQDIKDKPIGVNIDEDKQSELFEERKQIFDDWFETEWNFPCYELWWWCIDRPGWSKPLAYNLVKFDFSYDWAWDQFAKDHL